LPGDQERDAVLIDEVTPALGHLQREGRGGPRWPARRPFVRTGGQSGQCGERDGPHPERPAPWPGQFAPGGVFGCGRAAGLFLLTSVYRFRCRLPLPFAPRPPPAPTPYHGPDRVGRSRRIRAPRCQRRKRGAGGATAPLHLSIFSTPFLL